MGQFLQHSGNEPNRKALQQRHSMINPSCVVVYFFVLRRTIQSSCSICTGHLPKQGEAHLDIGNRGFHLLKNMLYFPLLVLRKSITDSFLEGLSKWKEGVDDHDKVVAKDVSLTGDLPI